LRLPSVMLRGFVSGKDGPDRGEHASQSAPGTTGPLAAMSSEVRLFSNVAIAALHRLDQSLRQGIEVDVTVEPRSEQLAA
jgi:hypothetical protein